MGAADRPAERDQLDRRRHRRGDGNPDLLFTAKGQEKLVCPSVNGGKNWPAGAYSPQTNAMYYPLQNMCMKVTTQDPDASLYAVNMQTELAAGTDKVGTVFAISAETGRTLWKYEQRAGILSLVATGGGLIFVGDAVGHFRALDDQSGKVLFDVNLGSPVSGYPITFAVERQTVRCGEHRPVARCRWRWQADTRIEAGHGESDVRLRAPMTPRQAEADLGQAPKECGSGSDESRKDEFALNYCC